MASELTGTDNFFVILIGFCDYADFALLLTRHRRHRIFDFGQDVRWRLIVNGLHCIEPQAVEMIFAGPVAGIVDNIAAHTFAAGLVIIDGLAPWGLMPGGEIGTEEPQIIALIPEVVIDDI